MTLTLVSLVLSTSLAADLNEDGCEDTYYDANGACVATTASLASGVTVGANAEVGDYADIGTETALASGAFIGARSTLVGRVGGSGTRPVGSDTVIGRRSFIGADHDIGSDNTFGRAVQAGERLTTEGDVTVGFGSELGDDVTLNSGATLGALVAVGNNTTVQAGAVLARGVTIADSSGTASIDGIIGPNVTIGENVNLHETSRIRKEATLGNDVTVLGGARIARGANIADGVTIGANARIGAGATVTATTNVPEGAVIPRGETYDDPSVGSFSGGTLLNPTEMAQINTWVGDANANWTLCYKRSVDGANATTFHSRCDAYTETVAVITLTNGKKVGGYTPIRWNSGCYSTEPTQSSFLFSLTNTYQHTLRSTNHHTCASTGHGTTFGGGHDLYINSSMNVGYCAVGHTYNCRPGFSGNSCRVDFCGGSGAVTVAEYEVYYRD